MTEQTEKGIKVGKQLLFRGWKSETLEELKLRFPDYASQHAFCNERDHNLLHGICERYNPHMDIGPILAWLCGFPHYFDINATRNGGDNGNTPLMTIAKRGHLSRIKAVVDLGADLNMSVRKVIRGKDPQLTLIIFVVVFSVAFA